MAATKARGRDCGDSAAAPWTLDALDHQRNALADADAHRAQAVAAADGFQLVQCGGRQPRTAGAERVAQRDGAAHRVDLALVQAQRVDHRQRLGNVLDEKALAEEHAKGRLLSALDVFDVEPLPAESELRNHWRCLLFPHQGGPSLDQYFKMMERTVENIRRYTKGEPILMEITAQKLRIMT